MGFYFPIQQQYLQGDTAPQSLSSPGFYKNKREDPKRRALGPGPSHTLCSPEPICCVDSSLTLGLVGRASVFIPTPSPKPARDPFTCVLLTTKHFFLYRPNKTSCDLHFYAGFKETPF